MADLLLIHGSGYRAAVWAPLIAALAPLGHRARAIDLPRHPGVTLADQARAICSALSTPCLLVGHSAAGYPITAAAETDPRHIRALVYLCAYLPAPGQSLAALRRAQGRQPLRPALRTDSSTGTYRFDPDAAGHLLFHDCPDPAGQAARLVAEPIAPQETALALTPASQSLPRFALTCRNDRALPPEDQDRMAATLPQDRVIPLDCGHSPFLAAPAQLARHLDEIARNLP